MVYLNKIKFTFYLFFNIILCTGGISVLKENLSSFVAPELFYEGECSTIYQLNDGRLLKLNSRYLQSLYFMAEVSYENKILDTRAHKVSEIVSP